MINLRLIDRTTSPLILLEHVYIIVICVGTLHLQLQIVLMLLLNHLLLRIIRGFQVFRLYLELLIVLLNECLSKFLLSVVSHQPPLLVVTAISLSRLGCPSLVWGLPFICHECFVLW